MYWSKSLGEKYMVRVKSTYIGQEPLGEKSQKPVEEESLGEESLGEESLGEKYINLKVSCLFLH